MMMRKGQTECSAVPARSGAKRTFLCLLIIAGATAAAFLPALGNGFTNWDDDAYITGNQDIQEFTAGNIKKIFSSSYVGNYQPITMLTYMVEHFLFGLNPSGYHGTSVLLHCVNGLLVFALVFGFSGSRAAGLIAALLFAVHPLRVESVAWVAERKDVLSTLFYLLSLLSYLRYIKKGGARKNLRASMAAMVLSLLSKPMAVSLPFVLLLIDYAVSRKIGRKALLEKAPFFAAAAVFTVITVVTQKSVGPVTEYYSPPLVLRLCVPFYGVIFYLFKTAVPLHLCPFYSFPEKPDAGMTALLLASPFIVAGLAALVAWYAARARRVPEGAAFLFGSRRTLVFGSLFFIITLAPVLQLVPVGGAIVAERYTYLPVIGLVFLLAEAGAFLLKVKLRESTAARTAFWAVFALAAAVLVFMTRERCGVWKNSITLWSDTIEKCPTAVAYTNRGAAYDAQGNHERAIENFNNAISLNPEYALEYSNRGLAYKAMGDFDRAIEDYTRAIRLNSKYAMAYCNRGVAYKAKGEIGRAMEDYDEAIRLNPEYAQAYNNRGVAKNALGDQVRAIEDFSMAIRFNPKYAQAYNNRGVAYCCRGEFGRGIEDYTKALALNPAYSEVYYNRGQAYRAVRDRGRALDDIKKACGSGIEAACRELAVR
jgi:tetratricopeptide (TPR) repeat protein